MNHGFFETLLHLCLESAPALLLGYALAGIMSVLLVGVPRRWMNGGGTITQALKGTVVGLPIPVCSCGVVPLYQSLIQRGVAAPAAMAFLIATPELGIEALILSIPLLGMELTIARMLGAFAVALIAGAIAGSLVRKNEMPIIDDEPTPGLTFVEKFKLAFRTGFIKVAQDTAPWIAVGLIIAAAFSTFLDLSALSNLPAGLDVVLFAVVGIPIYVCASGSTPIAAALVFAGVSPGAAVAFILAGPATNVTTFGVLTQLHSKRVAMIFGALVLGLAIGCGVVVNLFVAGAGTEIAAHEMAHGGFAWASLGLLAVVFGYSFYALGPMGVWRKLTFSSSHDHGSDDDDCCGSDSHEHDHHTPEHEPENASSDCCTPKPVVKSSGCCGSQKAVEPPKTTSCCGGE